MEANAVILTVYFVMSVLNILFKKILDEGTNPLVIITYRLIVGAISLAPIACFFESNDGVKLTTPILCSLLQWTPWMAGCQKWKPVAVIQAIYCVMALLNIFFKKILDEGTDHLVIIAYRLAAAAIFLMPVAYFCERRGGVKVKLTAPIICSLFVSALIGLTINQYLFLLGMHCTSAAYATGFVNMVPVFTFFWAILLGQESVNLKSAGKIAKVLGSLICIGAIVLLTMYRGIPLTKVTYSRTPSYSASDSSIFSKLGSKQRWILGSIFLVLSMGCWSGWFLIQAKIGKRYPCKYTTTALMSAFGALQSAILCFSISRNVSIWILHGKLQIFTVLFGGIIGSGLCYVGIAWCVEQRGPVFTSAFSPSIQMFITIMDLAFFHEQIYLGSVLGSILMICGLYILLWGKRNRITSPSQLRQCIAVAVLQLQSTLFMSPNQSVLLSLIDVVTCWKIFLLHIIKILAWDFSQIGKSCSRFPLL